MSKTTLIPNKETPVCPTCKKEMVWTGGNPTGEKEHKKFFHTCFDCNCHYETDQYIRLKEPSIDDKKYRYYHKKLCKYMINNQLYNKDVQEYNLKIKGL